MELRLDASFSVILERLLGAAERDVELSVALRAVAESVIRSLERQGEDVPINTAGDCPEVDNPDSGLSKVADSEPVSVPAEEPLPLLQMCQGFREESQLSRSKVYVCGGNVRTDATVSRTKPAPVATEERLREISEQLAMKARACRWILEHVAVPRTDVPAEFYGRKSEQEWHPWMITRFRPERPEDPAWLKLERVFLAATQACVNILEILENKPLRERFATEALSLARKVARALAAGVEGVGQGYDCSQLALLGWLDEARRVHGWASRQETTQQEGGETELIKAILNLGEETQAARHFGKEQRQLFNKARYHAKKITESEPEATAALDEWRALACALDDLVRRCGVRPSSLEIRGILLPIHERLPMLEEQVPGFDLCLRALDEFLSLTPAQSHAADPIPDAAFVSEARSLLQGTRIALIGGDMRPEAKRRLEEALGLKELIWVRSKVHASVESFRPTIIRPDVSLTLLAIRWSSHSYVDVRSYCDESGKPLVWLSGGYNPNQVAHQIIQQASERLAAMQQAQHTLPQAV